MSPRRRQNRKIQRLIALDNDSLIAPLFATTSWVPAEILDSNLDILVVHEGHSYHVMEESRCIHPVVGAIRTSPVDVFLFLATVTLFTWHN